MNVFNAPHNAKHTGHLTKPSIEKQPTDREVVFATFSMTQSRLEELCIQGQRKQTQTPCQSDPRRDFDYAHPAVPYGSGSRDI